MTKQEMLLAIVGGVFVLEALSVIIQVGSFQTTGTRLSNGADPHHFELAAGRSRGDRPFLDPVDPLFGSALST